MRQHLTNVYASLTLATGAAGVGAFIHIYTNLFSAGFVTMVAAMGLLLLLSATPFDGKNSQQRLIYLLGFAFFSGEMPIAYK